jgi:hypothetical protein
LAVRNHRLAALALFVALAIAHTWPLASDLGHLSRFDNADASLNTFVLAWDAHALLHSPLQLFEAPIFYPEKHTLAYSEHLILPAIMAAPLSWAGASPVIVHNVLFILGLALSAWAMCLVMVEWTGLWSAAIVAGLAYGFNAHVLARFAQLQAQHVEFFPFVLLAIDRVLDRRGVRDGVLLAAAFVLQSLCSNYLLAFTAVAMVAAVAVHPQPLMGRDRGRVIAILAAAGLASIVLLLPVLMPYYLVTRDQGLAWSLDEVRQYSAILRDYLATLGRLHFETWSARYFNGSTPLFPGITATLLALTGIALGPGIRSPRVRMAIAFGIIGVALSVGPALPGYAWLHAHVPIVGSLRAAARWGWLALAAIAILAGLGLAELERRWPKWSTALAIVAGLLITAEAFRAPVGFTTFDRIPRIYDRLATSEPMVVVELPIFAGRFYAENGRYMLYNTRYFKPLVNGYSSFQPNSYIIRGERLRNFPEPDGVAAMHEIGVTHLVVHVDEFRNRVGQGAYDAIARVPGLTLEAVEGGIAVYRLQPASRLVSKNKTAPWAAPTSDRDRNCCRERSPP